MNRIVKWMLLAGGALLVLLVAAIVFALVEVVGGIVSGSLALIADAGHMLSDALAVGLARASPTSTKGACRAPITVFREKSFKRVASVVCSRRDREV